jgi:hypothetical protein
MGVLMAGAVIYTFAGFWVYWLRTGQTRVGDGGTVSDIGSLVWLGPLIAIYLAYAVVGDRGPFRVLYLPRSTVDVGHDGLSWRTPAGAMRLDWEAIGGVSCLGDATGQATTVYDPAGIELGSITGAMVDTRTRRPSRLPEAILEVRLDLFEALNPKHPGNGCVRRLATPAS